MEHDPARVQVADEAGHVVHLVHIAKEGVAHVAPRGKRRLPILDMQRCSREQVGVAEMVVVKMRDDQRPDCLGLDAQRAQSIRRRAEKAMPPLRARPRVKSRVNEDGSLAMADEPDVISHIIGRVMRVRADRHLARR